MTTNDQTVLRDLARSYLEICGAPVQAERRNLWRKHNSLRQTRPLIYVRSVGWQEMPQSKCLCEDPVLRQYEDFFRYQLFWNSLNDDSIFEPWVTVRAARKCAGWGVAEKYTHSSDPRGAYKMDYPIKEPDDIAKLRMPCHEIDWEKTNQEARLLGDAIGDIITINVDTTPTYHTGVLDISSELGCLRGIENIMMDMLDRPEWLHQLVKFLADGMANLYDQAEAAGDWGLSPNFCTNQAMAYAEELDDPAPNVKGGKRSRLWTFMAAQEFTAVSPAMHEEFLLRYQLPILKKFGLVSYGCCEDLTNKITMIRQIPNLRRIAVTPFANVARCAEQIGRDYVLSYRPSPADMVSYGDFNPDRVRTILRKDLAVCRDSHVDVTLKDVETVQGDPDRIRRWVAITREIIEEVFG